MAVVSAVTMSINCCKTSTEKMLHICKAPIISYIHVCACTHMYIDCEQLFKYVYCMYELHRATSACSSPFACLVSG